MADLKTTVELVFEGVDRTSSAIDNISSSMDRFSGRVTAVTGPAADLTKTIIAIELAAAGAAIALGVTAYNASVKLESATADLAKVFAGTDDEFDAFVGSLTIIAQEYGVSSSEAIAAGADWLRAGKDTSDALGLVTLSIENAIAADIDYARSTESLKIITETYGGSVEDLRGRLDLLNTVSDNTATTSELLLDAIQRSAGAAKAAGFSFEELVAFLTPMVAQTQQGAESGNAFKTVLSNLIKPTNDQAAALGLLGISLEDSNGQVKSAKTIFQELVPALAGADAETQALVLATLAGAEQFSRLTGVVNGAETTLKILNGTLGETRTVADETARVMDTSEKIIERFKNSVTAASTAMGDQFNPAVDGILLALNELFNGLTAAIKSGALEELFEGLRERFGTLQDAISELAKNLPQALEGIDFSGFLKSIDNVGDSILGIFDVDLTSAEGLRAAIQFVIDAFTGLTNVTAGIITGFEPVIQTFVKLADGLGSVGPEALEFAGNILGIATSINTLLPIMTGFIGVLALVSGTQGLLGLIALAPKLGAEIVAIGVAIGASQTAMLGLIGVIGVLTFEITRLTGLGETLNDILANDWLAGYEDATLGTLFADLVDWFSSAISDGPKAISTLNGLNESVGTLTDDGLGGFSAELESLLGDQENWKQSLEATDDVINKAAIGYFGLADAAESTAESQAALTKSQNELVDGAIILADTGLTIAETFQKQAEDANKLSLAQQGLIPVTDEIIELWRGGPPIVDALAKSAGTLEEQLQEAANSGEVAKDKILELQVELEKAKLEAKVKLDIAELESQTEQLKIKFDALTELAQIQASIDIAQIEADAEKFKAILSSLDNTTIAITGNIDSLIGAIAGLDATDEFSNAKLEILSSALDRELTILELNAETQRKLADAQIEELQARANRLRSGEAIISIDGAGLEPELEAFMWKILQNIQIRANNDASAFLLGI